jgi:hypothetical protein
MHKDRPASAMAARRMNIYVLCILARSAQASAELRTYERFDTEGVDCDLQDETTTVSGAFTPPINVSSVDGCAQLCEQQRVWPTEGGRKLMSIRLSASSQWPTIPVSNPRTCNSFLSNGQSCILMHTDGCDSAAAITRPCKEGVWCAFRHRTWLHAPLATIDSPSAHSSQAHLDGSCRERAASDLAPRVGSMEPTAPLEASVTILVSHFALTGLAKAEHHAEM